MLCARRASLAHRRRTQLWAPHGPLVCQFGCVPSLAYCIGRILLPPDGPETLVVCNPPWGNNVGGEADGAAIVRTVASQCSGATLCWIVNARAARALVELPGVTVVRRVPLGAVEVVVVTT